MTLLIVCSILALVIGFCAGSLRSLETPEVNRLNKVYWETKHELSEAHEELEMLKGTLTSVRLELLKTKKRNERKDKCQMKSN